LDTHQVLPAALLHAVLGELHVVEHALQLGRELVPALRLELDDHGALQVVAHRPDVMYVEGLIGGDE
jgi:hypothetical protein